MSKFWLVCDSCYHNILIKYSLVGLRDIFIKGCHEIRNWIGILDWHNPLACFIIRSMQRYCKRNLRKINSDSLDTRNDTATRDRDTTTGEVQLLLSTCNTNRLCNIVIIQKWLSHSHIDNVSDFLIFFRKEKISNHNLIDNLIEFKITDETKFPCRTETTCHRTTYLTGDAKGISS